MGKMSKRRLSVKHEDNQLTDSTSRTSSQQSSPQKPRMRGGTNAARERSRVKTIRMAFLELQKTLPAVPRDTKLSKLDVLVLATTYIAHLTATLTACSNEKAGAHPRPAVHNRSETAGCSSLAASAKCLQGEDVRKHRRGDSVDEESGPERCRDVMGEWKTPNVRANDYMHPVKVMMNAQILLVYMCR